MAHYAFLDGNNIVTQVIVGKHEWEEGVDWEEHYGNFHGQVCKRTSYNTYEGKHHGIGGTPFRKNYASIGHTYDAARDAFIAPKPYPSWILNEQKCIYEPPVPVPPRPVGGTDIWVWDETNQKWILGSEFFSEE